MKVAIFAVLTLLAQPATAATIEDVVAPTAALAAPIEAKVYRPAGDPPAGGWPVLYLLHGRGGSKTDWLTLGDIEATLDRMIASGELRPMLVVMPSAGDSYYVDSTRFGGPGDMPSAILGDLRARIEQRYPVRRDAGGRAVAGLSMGGYGALRFALQRPELFASAAALSPAIWHNVPASYLDRWPSDLGTLADTTYYQRTDNYTVIGGVILPPSGGHFGRVFGTPFDARRFNAENVFTLLGEAQGAIPPIFLSVGDDDSRNFWRGTFAFFEAMQARGRPAELRVSDGDHVWSVWKVSIVEALRFVDRNWQEAPVGAGSDAGVPLEKSVVRAAQDF